MERQDFKIAKGDKVEVKWARINFQDKPATLPAKLKRERLFWYCGTPTAFRSGPDGGGRKSPHYEVNIIKKQIDYISN